MEDEGLESTTTNCIGSGSSNSSSSGGSLLSMHDDSSAGIRSDLGVGRPQFVFTSPSSKTPEPTSAAPTTSSSPPKKSGGSGGSRRSVQKRVVSVPITDADGSRSKGSGEGSPPSDSWTWRKYGQKPIKGSPYPRGYYRCSSSKGCPARKQVERSRTDPNLLVVTYASEHNHPWPLPKNHNNSNNNNHHNSLHPSSHASVVTTADPSQKPTTSPEEETEEVVLLPPAPSATTTTTTTTTTTANTTSTSSPEETSFSADLAEESSLMLTDHLGWFSGTSDTFLDGGSVAAMLLPVTYDDFGKDLGVGGCGGGPGGGGDDDDALFAELDELPECSMVFRRSAYDGSRGCSLTTSSWCGSTG